MRISYCAAAAAVGLLLLGCNREQAAQAPVEEPPQVQVEQQTAPANPNVIQTDAGDLTIQPAHHASFMMNWGGMNIMVDPAPAPGSQAADPTAEFAAMPRPDLILVTDTHGDHFNADVLNAVAENATIVAPQAVADEMPEPLKQKTQILANGESTTVGQVQIEAVPMYNLTQDRLQYHEKGRGNGYVVTVGGKRIYIAGDTEDIPEMRGLQNIDVAFVPFNLPYTMTEEQAADAVREFRPAVVYPYHYGQSDVNRFQELVGDASEVRLLQWY